MRKSKHANKGWVPFKIKFLAAAMLSGLVFFNCPPAHAASGKTVFVAIILDSSGSMGESVKNEKSEPEAKMQIAKRALSKIVDQIDSYASSAPVGASLTTFERTEIPMIKWFRKPFDEWISRQIKPKGGTPLGETILDVADSMKDVPGEKHIVVVTDGESNGSISPPTAMERVKKLGSPPRIHVVAFAVDAAVFSPMKAAGASVLPASGKNLSEGLKNLFANHILLENPE